MNKKESPFPYLEIRNGQIFLDGIKIKGVTSYNLDTKYGYHELSKLTLNLSVNTEVRLDQPTN